MVEVARFAGKYLRPPLTQWMEHVETKREVRKRLRHTGYGGLKGDASEKTHWVKWFGYADARYLPLKIHDGNWIAIKTTRKTGWLSCGQSLEEEDYCNADARCPNVIGGQVADDCYGEKFQIQTTKHGPIKFDKIGEPNCNYCCLGGDFSCCEICDKGRMLYNKKIAFKYAKVKSKRGGVTFWLSKYYQDHRQPEADKLYTMPCPGKTFTKRDIPRCGDEVFSIYKYFLKDNYLRNGDRLFIEEIGEVFLLQQYYGV